MALVSDYLNQQIDQSLKIDDRQQIGIEGFTADVRVRESVRMESTVTTRVLEDGSTATDHVINNPITLEIEGEVSDIHVKPSTFQNLFRRAAQPIGVISKYAPASTASQLNKIQELANDAQDIIRKVDDVIEDGQALLDLVGDKSESQKPTQVFFDIIEALRDARLPIKIEMPYKVYDQMVITSISINTDNIGEPLSYSLSAQQIRFAQIEFVQLASIKANPSTDLGGQTDGEVNKGINKGKEPESSSLYKLIGG